MLTLLESWDDCGIQYLAGEFISDDVFEPETDFKTDLSVLEGHQEEQSVVLLPFTNAPAIEESGQA